MFILSHYVLNVEFSFKHWHRRRWRNFAVIT